MRLNKCEQQVYGFLHNINMCIRPIKKITQCKLKTVPIMVKIIVITDMSLIINTPLSVYIHIFLRDNVHVSVLCVYLSGRQLKC